MAEKLDEFQIRKKLVEDLSDNVFAPDGKTLSWYLSVQTRLNQEFTKLKVDSDFNAMVEALHIMQYHISTVNTAKDLYKLCSERIKCKEKPLNFDTNVSAEKFVNELMDAIHKVHFQAEYSSRNDDPPKSRTKNGLAAQKKDMDLLGNKSKAPNDIINRDVKLYNKLAALLQESGAESHRNLKTYIRMLGKADAKRFGDVDSMIDAGYVHSGMFVNDGGETEFYCMMKNARYSRVNSDFFEYRCISCGTRFSSLLFSKCPCCSDSKVVVDRVLDGEFRVLDPRFVTKLSELVTGLNDGSGEDVESAIGRMDEKQKTFYRRFYGELVDELQAVTMKEFLDPLEEISSKGYSEENYRRLKELVTSFDALPDSKRRALTKSGFKGRLDDVSASFRREYCNRAAADFSATADKVLSSNPGRDAVKSLNRRFGSLEPDVVQILKGRGVDRRIKDALDSINRGDAESCAASISEVLGRCANADLAEARRAMARAEEIQASLHPDALPFFEGTGAVRLMDDFRAKVKHMAIVESLRGLMEDIDRMYGKSMDQALVAECRVLDGRVSDEISDGVRRGILSERGYLDKMEELKKRSREFRSSEAEKRLAGFVSEIFGTDPDADVAAVARADAFVQGIDADIREVFESGRGWADYCRVRSDVFLRKDRYDAECMDGRMKELESMADDLRFETAFHKVKHDYRNLNERARSIVDGSHSGETRFAALERRFRAIKVDEYTDSLRDRIMEAACDFNGTPLAVVEKLSSEVSSADAETRESLVSKIGREGVESMGSMLSAKKTMTAVTEEIGRLVSSEYRVETGRDIRNLESRIASIPANYAERFRSSDANRSLVRFVTDYGQWQLMNMVQPIMSNVEAIEEGTASYDSLGPVTESMYNNLLQVHRDRLDAWGFRSRFVRTGSVQGRQSGKLRDLAAACEAECDSGTSAFEDKLNEFREFYDGCSEQVRRDASAQALVSRVNNAESAYWNRFIRQSTKLVESKTGLFKKFDADDVANITDAYGKYRRMPKEYLGMYEDTGKKLEKLYNKVRK